MENAVDALKMAAAILIFIIALATSFSIFGTTKFSITFFIKVLLPVLTAPTTPRKIHPFPLVDMLFNISFFSISHKPFNE